MATPLPDDLGRLGWGAESTFKTGVSVTANVGGLTALDVTHDRAGLAKPILRNSEKDGFADEPGWQTADIQIEHIVTDLTPTHVGDWFKCSLGEEVTAVTLPAFSSGTTGSVTVGSSTTFDDILKVPTAGGTFYVPVKSKTTTVATFAFLLTGAASAKPKNASETSGKAWRDSKSGTVTSFTLIRDQGGLTGETWETFTGCVPKVPGKIVYTPNGLLKIRWGFEASTFTLSTSAGSSGLSDASDNTEAYISDVVSFGLQDMGTPVALAGLTIKALELSFGYGLEPLTGGVGISGSTVTASNRSGYFRHNSGVELISVTINDGNWKTYDDARVAKTPYLFWVEFQPGSPTGTTGSSRLCIFKPRVKVRSARPVTVDGVRCTALTLQVERASGMKREYVSFFGTT